MQKAEDKARLLKDTRQQLDVKQAALDNMISRNECLKDMVGGNRIISKNDAGEYMYSAEMKELFLSRVSHNVSTGQVPSVIDSVSKLAGKTGAKQVIK